MTVKPEYFRKRLDYLPDDQQQTRDAADMLESIVDIYLYQHVYQMKHEHSVAFPLAEGSRSEVVSDVVGRYRSVGWNVERRDEDGADVLRFNLMPPAVHDGATDQTDRAEEDGATDLTDRADKGGSEKRSTSDPSSSA